MFDTGTNFYNIEDSKRLYYEMKHEKEKYEKLERLTYQDYINKLVSMQWSEKFSKSRIR